jgi:hypothetical protein
MKPTVGFVVWSLVLNAVAVAAAEPNDRFAPVLKGGGIQVYLKMDFDQGENPFTSQGKGEVTLSDRHAVSGRSVYVRRSEPGGYFGGHTSKVAVRNTPGLNIAFCVRAEGMRNVSVNFYDATRRDNTTPTSPARVQDGEWRTVVYAVEDFHHNSDPPQRKVPAETEHTGLLFHGPENAGAAGQFWIDKLIIYRGRDTEPPEAPAELKTSRDGPRVTLTWSEPNDNAFPAVYSIYRKFPNESWEKIGESVLPKYVDNISAVAGPCSYRVTAADYDNNVSGPSAEVKAVLPADRQVPSPCP